MVVRQLITLMGFRVNTASLAQAQTKMGAAATSMAAVGRNLTLFLSLPLALAAKGLVVASANMEKLKISFEVMLGSAEKSEAFIKDIFQFAKESPLFEVKEIGDQAKKLLAVGFAASEVIPNLKILGDIAAGVNVPLERIVLNYSQVRAQGKLTGRELRDFAVAGVPLLDTLAKQLGKTRGEVFRMIRSSKIPFEAVEQAFKNMTGEGGLFFNLSQRMATTLFGKFQKLKDEITIMSIELGDKLRPLMLMFIKLFEKVIKFVRGLQSDTKRFMLVIGGLLIVLGPIILAIKLIIFLAGVITIKLLAIAAVVALVVDDIVVWIAGGRSVMGLLFGDFDIFKEKFKNISFTIKEWWASKGKEMLFEMLRLFGDIVKEGIKPIGEAIKWIIDMMEGEGNAVVGILTFIGQFLLSTILFIKSLIFTLLKVVKGVVTGFWLILKSLFKLIGGLLTFNFEMIRDGVIDLVNGIVTLIVAKVRFILIYITAAYKSVKRFLPDWLTGSVGGVIDFIDNFDPNILDKETFYPDLSKKSNSIPFTGPPGVGTVLAGATPSNNIELNINGSTVEDAPIIADIIGEKLSDLLGSNITEPINQKVSGKSAEKGGK